MKATPFFILLGFILLSCNQNAAQHDENNLQSDEQKPQIDTDYFLHGVASGDPTDNQVIIWTRISNSPGDIEVVWELSKDQNFNEVLDKGTSKTNSRSDFTVKVDVKGLISGSKYFYRFMHNERYSPTGKTKTLASNKTDDIKLGIVSCSNYEFGYFNAYDGLAKENLDAILHLGDYIYEYAPNKYGDKDFERKHLPTKELLTLEDYRTRYAQYRTDLSLQKAHQMHPFIMIWDDHEIANNAYQKGAQNHQDNEGDFMERKRTAKQAYYEWQPIRESKDSVLYRSFKFGNMVDLIMLDERYVGRNEPPKSKEDAKLQRSMLGSTQLQWLKNKLSTSTAKWKVIGNQVIFAPCDLSLVRPDSPINLDAWDGYDYERNQIVDFLSKTPIDNTIFVTGDTHSSWAFEVPSNSTTSYKVDGKSCAIEIGTPSITSANWDERGTTEETILGEQALLMSNPHLKYVNGRDHGYVILNLTTSDTRAQWYYTQDIKHTTSEIILAKEIAIGLNQKFIEE
ncbi:MAG: alkaline phosphatase D [Saprospiraceae bacterium]|jgi:alkaline phosphatase D